MIAVAKTMLRDRVAERGDDAHRQHEQREGHDRVDQPRDHAVRPAAEEAGAGAERAAERERQRDRAERDAEIEARGDDHAAQDVAAELVGAEPVRPRRRLQRRAASLASGS